MALGAAGAAAFGHWRLHASIASSVTVAGFGLVLFLSLLELLSSTLAIPPDPTGPLPPLAHRLYTALYKGTRLGVIAILLLTVGYGALVLGRMDRVISLHGAEATRKRVSHWILAPELALGASIVLLVFAALYSAWKFRSTRFAESRVGEMKDLLLILQDLRHRHGWEKALPEARRLTIRHLRRLLALSNWDSLLTRLAAILRRKGCTRVELLEFDPASGGFRILSADYPERMPKGALEVHQWLDAHYKPAKFDQTRFDELVAIAKGNDDRGWEKRFFNMPGRGLATSAAGWVAATGKVLQSNVAEQCIYFDESYRDQLLKAGFAREYVDWVEIRSFVACPVLWGPDALPQVLFASKNISYGFVPEDAEVVLAIAQILRLTTGTRSST